MEPNTQNQSSGEYELSLRDLIIQFTGWISYLLKNWLLIGGIGLFGAGLGLAYSYFQKTKYSADLTFVLEDSKANALAGYAGLASQFGIDLGGSSGSGIFTGDNIIEFLKSRLMVEKTLLSPALANNKTQTLADIYIATTDIHKKLSKKDELKNIKFPVGLDRKNFSLQQDSVLNILYQEILKKNLSVVKPDKKLSFIAVKCISPNEFFSKYFVETLVKEATEFYIQTKTKRSKTNVDKLQEKADSLEQLLNRKTYSAAASQDLNLNPARNVARVGTELETRDKVVLQTMYAEVVKNLEISRMSMAQETPIIQIVDTPILPLKKERFGKLKGIILGGFLFTFFTVLVLIARRIFRKIMA